MCSLWDMNWDFIAEKRAIFIVTAAKTRNPTLYPFVRTMENWRNISRENWGKTSIGDWRWSFNIRHVTGPSDTRLARSHAQSHILEQGCKDSHGLCNLMTHVCEKYLYTPRHRLYLSRLIFVFLSYFTQIPGQCPHLSHDFPLHLRMMSSGMLRRVVLVTTDVSEELSAFFIRVTRIGEPGTTLAVTSNRRTLSSQRTSVSSYS
jgi:hypothetical protein